MSLVKPRTDTLTSLPKREGWVGKLNRNSIAPTLPSPSCAEGRVGDLPLIDGSIMVCSTPSHVLIVGTASTLGRHPVDILIGILDVAGLTVDAILRVDDVG
jgi:hypothetical protein